MTINQIQNTIIDAFKFRFATKEFDTKKKISDSEFNTILEAGRLSPSSLGLEPWRFLVIQNETLREKLIPYSSGAQKQLKSASHFVLILARKNVTPTSDYVQSFIRGIKQYEESTIPMFEDKVQGFQTRFHINDNARTILDWASKQTYIALGNMMTAAALMNIDSCPMEGFDLDGVTELLEHEGIIDSNQFAPSVMVAFGYRKENPTKPKTRQPQEDVIEWIN